MKESKAQKLRQQLKAFLVSAMVGVTSVGNFAHAGIVGKMLFNVSDVASVYNITDQKVTVLKDNVLSYNEKLRLIDSAKPGSTLDLAYYIFSDDESSAFLASRLVEAATKRNVKVRVLVDLLTNYNLIDYYRTLEDLGTVNGSKNIEFRFYNRPTPNIIRDALYMATSCKDIEANPSKTKEQKTKECIIRKQSEANTVNTNNNTEEGILAASETLSSDNAKLLLASLYGKNALGFSVLSERLGYDKFAASNKGQPMSKQSKEDLKSLVKLYVSYLKATGPAKVALGIKIKAAEMFYGEEVTDIIAFIDKAFPTSHTDGQQTSGVEGNRAKDWEFLTDYLHQKLILAQTNNGYEFITGGRNVENSYHMQLNPSGKYTFNDTDALVVTNQGKEMREKFENLWNFSKMVATIKQVDKVAPKSLLNAIGACALENQSKADDVIAACVKNKTNDLSSMTQMTSFVTKTETEKLKNNVKRFEAFKDLKKFLGVSKNDAIDPSDLSTKQRDSLVALLGLDGSDKNKLPRNDSYSLKEKQDIKIKEFLIANPALLDPTNILVDAKTGKSTLVAYEPDMVVSYFENVPYNKSELSGGKKIRKYGAQPDAEEQSGKNIHKLWVEKMKELCDGDISKHKEIIFQSAYVVMPSPILAAIGELTKSANPKSVPVSSDYMSKNCSNITIKIITNSIQSTDLSIINAFARIQFHEMTNVIVNNHKLNPELKSLAAKVQYFEYTPHVSTDKPSSLHSKVTVIGDDVFIGSANSDVRSYFMDANNGILVENAPKFAKQYRDYINGMIAFGESSSQEIDNALSFYRDYTEYNDELNRLTPSITDAFKNVGDKNLGTLKRVDKTWVEESSKNNGTNSQIAVLDSIITGQMATMQNSLKHKSWASTKNMLKFNKLFREEYVSKIQDGARSSTEFLTDLTEGSVRTESLPSFCSQKQVIPCTLQGVINKQNEQKKAMDQTLRFY